MGRCSPLPREPHIGALEKTGAAATARWRARSRWRQYASKRVIKARSWSRLSSSICSIRCSASKAQRGHSPSSRLRKVRPPQPTQCLLPGSSAGSISSTPPSIPTPLGTGAEPLWRPGGSGLQRVLLMVRGSDAVNVALSMFPAGKSKREIPDRTSQRGGAGRWRNTRVRRPGAGVRRCGGPARERAASRTGWRRRRARGGAGRPLP